MSGVAAAAPAALRPPPAPRPPPSSLLVTPERRGVPPTTHPGPSPALAAGSTAPQHVRASCKERVSPENLCVKQQGQKEGWRIRRAP